MNKAIILIPIVMFVAGAGLSSAYWQTRVSLAASTEQRLSLAASTEQRLVEAERAHAFASGYVISMQQNIPNSILVIEDKTWVEAINASHYGFPTAVNNKK